jgi:hypothetical protein
MLEQQSIALTCTTTPISPDSAFIYFPLTDRHTQIKKEIKEDRNGAHQARLPLSSVSFYYYCVPLLTTFIPR